MNSRSVTYNCKPASVCKWFIQIFRNNPLAQSCTNDTKCKRFSNILCGLPSYPRSLKSPNLGRRPTEDQWQKQIPSHINYAFTAIKGQKVSITRWAAVSIDLFLCKFGWLPEDSSIPSPSCSQQLPQQHLLCLRSDSPTLRAEQRNCHLGREGAIQGSILTWQFLDAEPCTEHFTEMVTISGQ